MDKKEYQRDYYRRTKEARRQYKKECHKEYYQRTREARRKYGREYYQQHKEAIKEHKRNCYQQIREAQRQQKKEHRQQLKIEILSHYSMMDYPICAYCGITDIEVLCVDHIEDEGAQHRKSLGISTHQQFYNWLIKNKLPAGFQVLCYNCNMKKYFRQKEERSR